MEDQPSPDSVFTCGECDHWVAMPDKTQVNGSEHAPRNGTCWRYPPRIMPIQQKNALGQTQNGFINVRPPVMETERACGDFESKDVSDLDD